MLEIPAHFMRRPCVVLFENVLDSATNALPCQDLQITLCW